MDEYTPVNLSQAIDLVYDPLESITRENFDAENYILNIANNYE